MNCDNLLDVSEDESSDWEADIDFDENEVEYPRINKQTLIIQRMTPVIEKTSLRTKED